MSEDVQTQARKLNVEIKGAMQNADVTTQLLARIDNKPDRDNLALLDATRSLAVQVARVTPEVEEEGRRESGVLRRRVEELERRIG